MTDGMIGTTPRCRHDRSGHSREIQGNEEHLIRIRGQGFEMKGRLTNRIRMPGLQRRLFQINLFSRDESVPFLLQIMISHFCSITGEY
jgi:hypothetical protein